jgi:hypothetical protein
MLGPDEEMSLPSFDNRRLLALARSEHDISRDLGNGIVAFNAVALREA